MRLMFSMKYLYMLVLVMQLDKGIKKQKKEKENGTESLKQHYVK